MKDSNSAVKKSKNIGTIISSLALGAIAGSAIALLFAPRKGKDLRKKISGKTDEFTESMKSKFNSILQESKSEYEKEEAKAKMHINVAKENAKDFAENTKA